MELNPDIIREIVKGNERFISPYSDPEPYFMYNLHGCANHNCDETTAGFFYDKLRYAVQNAAGLIHEAFREAFFDFYGVDQTAVSSPEQMCSELIFESFSLDTDDMTVGAYLSNARFMPGHFIEVHWENNWKIRDVWIN